jgi:hypothetical protein
MKLGIGYRGALCLLLGLASCPGVVVRANEVYKSVDAEGHVVYSDRADSKTAEKAVVKVDQPDPKEVARMAREQELLKVEDFQRKRQQAMDDGKKAQQDLAKQTQCENARSRYGTMKDARRIFQRDAEGNRVYYSDAEADAKREEARLAMVSACGA